MLHPCASNNIVKTQARAVSDSNAEHSERNKAQLSLFIESLITESLCVLSFHKLTPAPLIQAANPIHNVLAISAAACSTTGGAVL